MRSFSFPYMDGTERDVFKRGNTFFVRGSCCMKPWRAIRGQFILRPFERASCLCRTCAYGVMFANNKGERTRFVGGRNKAVEPCGCKFDSFFVYGKTLWSLCFLGIVGSIGLEGKFGVSICIGDNGVC